MQKALEQMNLKLTEILSDITGRGTSGVGIDVCRAYGLSEPMAFRTSLGIFGLCCALSYAWYVWPPRRWRDPNGAGPATRQGG